jgi:hypothetical protein
MCGTGSTGNPLLHQGLDHDDRMRKNASPPFWRAPTKLTVEARIACSGNGDNKLQPLDFIESERLKLRTSGLQSDDCFF